VRLSKMPLGKLPYTTASRPPQGTDATTVHPEPGKFYGANKVYFVRCANGESIISEACLPNMKHATTNPTDSTAVVHLHLLESDVKLVSRVKLYLEKLWSKICLALFQVKVNLN